MREEGSEVASLAVSVKAPLMQPYGTSHTHRSKASGCRPEASYLAYLAK